MGESRSKWGRSPFLLGMLAGWVVGMLWWTGLVIAFGSSTVVTSGGSGFEEREITVFSRLRYAPLVAVPWGVVGLVAGAVASAVRGPWVPMFTGLGAGTGGAYSLATSPFDGWLALTMPVCCLGGALAGCAAGAITGAVWRSLAGVAPDAEPGAAPDPAA